MAQQLEGKESEASFVVAGSPLDHPFGGVEKERKASLFHSHEELSHRQHCAFVGYKVDGMK